MERLFGDWYGTKSGTSVSKNDALKYTAFYACVDLISRGIAQLPLPLYQRTADDGRKRASAHPVYELVHTRPNAEQTAFIWRQTMQSWVLTTGNAYSEIERAETSGRPLALWPLPPETITVQRDARGAIEYVQGKNTGDERHIPADKMLHIRTMGDGIVGKSPVRLFAESIGLGLAAERAGSAFFGNGMKPGGVLEHPGALSDDGIANLKKSLSDEHGGPDNAGKLLILEEGMKYNPLTIPPDDAQFLETRQFQVRDMARVFHVPPHKLAELADATFSNVEEQNIEWVSDGLGPWLVNWEQELSWKLLSPTERKRYFVEFVLEGLLRGNSEARGAFYSTMFGIGAYSINTILRKENENPIGPAGDAHFVPLNMTTAEALLDASLNPEPEPGPAPEPEPDDDDDDDAGQDTRAHLELLTDACGRIVRGEAESLRKGAKRGRMAAEVAQMADSGHRTRVRTVLSPAVKATAAILGHDPESASVRAFVDGQVTAHHADVGLVGAADDFSGALLMWAADTPAAWANEILTALEAGHGAF